MSSKVILKGRLHDRAKMARIRQKLERFHEFLKRNSEVLSVPQLVHRRLWTRHGTDKTSLFLCKNYWNRSSFCRIRAIFALSCKRPLIVIAARAKMSLSRAQNIFMPANINSIVILFMSLDANRNIGIRSHVYPSRHISKSFAQLKINDIIFKTQYQNIAYRTFINQTSAWSIIYYNGLEL